MPQTATAPIERPILFQGEMVRAILAGSKTQTRRHIKPEHIPDVPLDHIEILAPSGKVSYRRPPGHPDVAEALTRPGYTTRTVAEGLVKRGERRFGQPGDVLWVREKWQALMRAGYDADTGRDDAPYLWHEFPLPKPVGGTVRYAATDTPLDMLEGWKWNPSIHMPRWASRLSLTVKGVRVEHLHDITEADAEAEGVGWEAAREALGSYAGAFSALWEKINGDWDANPLLYVVDFERRAATAPTPNKDAR